MLARRVGEWLRQAVLAIGRILSPAQLAAICVLLVTALALFVPPFVGMADNGDFFRLLYSNGLYVLPASEGQYFGHFVKQYGILQYYNENGSTIVSSQSLFLHLALFLNKLLFSADLFDIRFQGAIFALLYAGAVYLLVEALTWNVRKSYGFLIAGMAIFLFGDSGYTAYFNSFYGESIVLIMMVYLFASWLLLYRKRYNDYAMLAVFLVSALLLTTSKQQNAPVGIIVAFLGLLLLWIRRDRLFRAVTALSLLSLLAAGVGTYTMISKEFVNINQYHAMTRGVLLHSAQPEEALRSLGINEQYAILKNNIYYEQFSTIDVNSPLLDKQFYSKYGFFSIAGYYLTHLDQLGGLLHLAAQDAFTIRPAAMGNYEADTGKAFRAQTHFFTGYSFLKQKLAPKTFGFIVLWMALVLGLYAPSFVAAFKARSYRLLLRYILLLTMMAVGLSGIVVSIIGAGDADLAKHEFLFTVAFDLVTFLAVSDAVSRTLLRNHPDAAGIREQRDAHPTAGKSVPGRGTAL